MNLKATIVLLLLASILNAEELPVYWSKGLIGPQVHVGHVGRRAFVIFVVGYTLDGYYAYCAFSNQSSKPMRVVGARDKSGQFRARATLSVSITQEGPWKKVADVAPAGPEATLAVGPHSDSEAVIVDLNKLAALIDKFAYAKISMPTGEETVFWIKELKH
ncbi:MAG TPA: hypothetical protein VEP30_05300 [Chthoniobacterales bacterium]|nr:hypothetical protein [Chthoniobacterales bacterium]